MHILNKLKFSHKIYHPRMNQLFEGIVVNRCLIFLLRSFYSCAPYTFLLIGYIQRVVKGRNQWFKFGPISLFLCQTAEKCSIIRVMIYKTIPNPSVQIIPEEFIASEKEPIRWWLYREQNRCDVWEMRTSRQYCRREKVAGFKIFNKSLLNSLILYLINFY